MKLFKRGLMVAVLSVSALMATAGIASADHIPNGPYTATGSLTLDAGLGSTCNFQAVGALNSAAHSGTVTSFSAPSCNPFSAAQAVTSSGTWNMTISGNVVDITNVSGTASVLGTTCTFADDGGIYAEYNAGPPASLTFVGNQGSSAASKSDPDSYLEITNTCAFGILQPGDAVFIEGTLTL